jgi:hypothetical protein
VERTSRVGNTGYEISASGPADVTIRINNTAAQPNLRMQLADDAAAVDFVLVDDGDAGNACTGATAIKSIRLDPGALHADLTVSLSRAPTDYKIYLRSANFSQQDAAGLFAAIWQTARNTAGSGREFAARD